MGSGNTFLPSVGGKVCDQSRTALSVAEDARGLSAFWTLRLPLDAPLPPARSLARGEGEERCVQAG